MYKLICCDICCREAYPESLVEDIQFAYNIAKLAKLDKKR